VSERSETSAWRLLTVLGLALAAVGLVDVAMLFFPARPSAVDWEFGTISGVFEGLPLVTIGVGLMAAGAIARAGRGWLMTMAVVQLILALVLMVLLVVFVLDIPVVLGAVDPQMKFTAKQSIVKSGLMAVVYVLTYLTLGIWAARRVRAASRGA